MEGMLPTFADRPPICYAFDTYVIPSGIRSELQRSGSGPGPKLFSGLPGIGG